MPGALYGGGGGSRANTCRKQMLTKWSHPLSLAGRSASTRAWNATYVCGPCLTRSDTVSTWRRARRRKADNSTGSVGIGSDISLSKTAPAIDTGERVDSGWPVPRAAGCMMHDTLHDTVALPRPLSCSPLSPLLLRCLWCCPLCARLGTTQVLVGVWCGGVGGGGGAARRWLGSPPLEFPLGGADACTPRQGVTLLYGPSICTRSVPMDLRRNQVLRPFPTLGAGTLCAARGPCGIGASLAYPDGRCALPAAPHRTRTAVRAVGCAPGHAHWPTPQAGATSSR